MTITKILKMTSKKEHGVLFNVHRISILIFCCLAYAIALFHKFAPAVLYDSMAQSFKVTPTDLSIFSSMYFWPYAIVQPFCGMISDVTDPGFIIGLSTLLVAVGSLITGLSEMLPLAVFGRFLVGVGSGLSYVPTCRIFLTWFKSNLFGILSGILLSIGACGGVIGQGPLASLTAVMSWRWAFHISAIVGLIIGVVSLIIIRDSPQKFGYPPVEGADSYKEEHMTFIEHLKLLGSNFLDVIKVPAFWLITPFFLLENGSFIGFTGLWAGPYLRDVFGYDSQTAGNVLMVFTIAQIAGAIILPFLVFKIDEAKRKWILVASSVIAMLCAILFATLDTHFNTATVVAILAIDTIVSTAIASVSFPYARLCFKTSVGSTVIGCLNFWAFVGSAALQNVTGALMDGYKAEVEGTYQHRGYQLVVWVITACVDVIPAITLGFAKPAPNSEAGHKNGEAEEEDGDGVTDEIAEL